MAKTKRERGDDNNDGPKGKNEKIEKVVHVSDEDTPTHSKRSVTESASLKNKESKFIKTSSVQRANDKQVVGNGKLLRLRSKSPTPQPDKGAKVKGKKTPSRSPSPRHQAKGKEHPAKVERENEKERGRKGKPASATSEGSERVDRREKKRARSESPNPTPPTERISKKNRRSLPLVGRPDENKMEESETSEESTSDDEEVSTDDSSSSDDDSSSSSSDEESPDRSKSKKKRKKKRKSTEGNKKRAKSLKKLRKKFFKKQSKKDKYKFKLSKDLAFWANDNIKNFRPDKEISDDIMLKNQVPTNIKETPTVDLFIQSILTERHRKDHVFDGSLARLSKKVTDIFGPLSKVWEAIKACNVGSLRREELSLESVAENLRLTVLLTGQAVNAITFHRRRTILRALIEDDDKAGNMLRKTYSEELKENGDLLFGEEFRKKATKDAKEERKTLKEFLASGKKPFRTASSQIRNPESERKRGRNESRENNRDRPPRETTDRDGHNNRDGGRGKVKKHLLQYALKDLISNRSRVGIKRNPSCSEQSVSQKELSELSSGGEAQILCGELEKTDEGPNNPENHNRMGDSLHGETTPEDVQTIPLEQTPEKFDNSGGREHVGEGSYKKSPILPGSSPKQYLFKGKEGRDFQTDHRSEKGERIYSLPEIQNGDPEEYQESVEGGGLDGENRPQGRLLHSSPSREIEEIPEIHVGREYIRIPLYDVWTGSGSPDLHQDHESTHESPAKVENSHHNIHGRHAVDGSGPCRNNPSQGHHDSPVGISRLHYKLQEVSPRSVNSDRVSRGDGRQHVNVPEYPTGEDGKPHENVQGNHEPENHDHAKISKGAWQAESHRIGILMGSLTNKVPPTNPGGGVKKGFVVRIPHNLIQGGHMGTGMVAKQHDPLEWESFVNKSPGPLHSNRCSEREEGGLGGRMHGHPNGGTLEEQRERSPHQCPGTDSSRARPEILYERKVKHQCPSKDGQHNCSELHDQDGRNEELGYDSHNQEDLVLSVAEQDRPECGIHSLQTECGGGLGIPELERLQRMEAEPTDFSQDLLDLGSSGHGLVCFQGISPDLGLHELEAGPRQLGDGCPIPGLDGAIPICFPSFLPDRESTEESTETQIGDDHHYSHLGHSGLVSPASGDGYPGAFDSTQRDPHIEGSSWEVSPPSGEQHHEIGSLADLGGLPESAQVSQTAAKLIENSKSKGTRRNYKSAWNQFCGWCNRRQVDPFHCDIEHILSFLGELFDRKLEHGSIGNYRSAISAYHAPIDGVKVGSHPLVCALMKGVSNERPPQPKYTYVWDVERVLIACHNMPRNGDLTLKQLSYKVVTLLGLCNINRGAELAALNVKWISKFEDGYVCSFGVKAKNSKKGKPAKPVKFKKHVQDDKLCPVACLEEYLNRTATFRAEMGSLPLFLSVNKPHKPVTRSTITKWVLKMLDIAGIDTKKFQAHSLRAASTSKVAALGLRLSDILNMGNWSGESVWQRFYHKPISSASDRYQTTLLSSADKALKKDLPNVEPSL